MRANGRQQGNTPTNELDNLKVLKVLKVIKRDTSANIDKSEIDGKNVTKLENVSIKNKQNEGETKMNSREIVGEQIWKEERVDSRGKHGANKKRNEHKSQTKKIIIEPGTKSRSDKKKNDSSEKKERWKEKRKKRERDTQREKKIIESIEQLIEKEQKAHGRRKRYGNFKKDITETNWQSNNPYGILAEIGNLEKERNPNRNDKKKTKTKDVAIILATEEEKAKAVQELMDRGIMAGMTNYEKEFKATILSLKEARLALEREGPPRVDKGKQPAREQPKRWIVDEDDMVDVTSVNSSSPEPASRRCEEAPDRTPQNGRQIAPSPDPTPGPSRSANEDSDSLEDWDVPSMKTNSTRS
jgi:hypothetical protein